MSRIDHHRSVAHHAGLRFAGYAALFDKVDAGRDLIKKGAFLRSLAELRMSDQRLALLWQHRCDQRVGWIERICEDERGLRVIGCIDHAASRAARLVKTGGLSGLSFGYRARHADMAVLGDGRQGRALHCVDLFEVSLVSRPMQHGSRIHCVS
ncbi:HK97 family phage prohead protease [Croceicoccus sp. F390]|uniref:HK97 family phage prohead protease n=1 Tax=Croceicoccus esteveae TaxID=3075597 RepID=A0ABU2ZJG1_9SPHN|nr:HK97 family phage prohead protease [Croceicoccus sp. F390]MDT0576525.1 HK97 family phage prohead protease [Croceicoccus sp. F390]